MIVGSYNIKKISHFRRFGRGHAQFYSKSKYFDISHLRNFKWRRNHNFECVIKL